MSLYLYIVAVNRVDDTAVPLAFYEIRSCNGSGDEAYNLRRLKVVGSCYNYYSNLS